MTMLNQLNQLLTMGGFTAYLLLAASILALAVALERVCFYFLHFVDYSKLFLELKKLGGDKEKLISLCKQKEKSSEIFQAALDSPEALEIALEEERLKRENYLPLLGTIAAVAPFLGLLGTVSGIIRTFQDIAKEGSTNLAVISGGVGEALIATFLGLLIAIFAVVFFNFFKIYTQNYLARARNLALKLAGNLRGDNHEKQK